MVATLAFYLFAGVLVAAATMVVVSRNPVHSVLFLILCFFNAAALFLIAGAEFLAMILVIVYVGAVAVLFLFVVMMLDVDFAALRSGFQRYAPIGAAIGAVLFIELLLVVGAWQVAPGAATLRLSPIPAGTDNTAALGRVIYTQHVLSFQVAGLILLVAMIGAIVLTLRDRRRSLRQDIAAQVSRQVADTLVLADVPQRAGIGATGIYRPLPPPEPKPREIAHEGTHGGPGAHH
jgi:NADH-quinone oxidoreductase subunit J